MRSRTSWLSIASLVTTLGCPRQRAPLQTVVVDVAAPSVANRQLQIVIEEPNTYSLGQVRTVHLDSMGTGTFSFDAPVGRTVVLKAVRAGMETSWTAYSVSQGEAATGNDRRVNWVFAESFSNWNWPQVTWKTVGGRLDVYVDNSPVGTTVVIGGVRPDTWHTFQWRDRQGKQVCTTRDSIPVGLSRCHICDPGSNSARSCQ